MLTRVHAPQWLNGGLERLRDVERQRPRLPAPNLRRLFSVAASETALWGVGLASTVALRLGRPFSAARASAARRWQSVGTALRPWWASHAEEAIMMMLAVGLAVGLAIAIVW